MTALVLIGLIVVAAVLWQRDDALKLRIASLELALDRGERIARDAMADQARFERADWITPGPSSAHRARSAPRDRGPAQARRSAV